MNYDTDTEKSLSGDRLPSALTHFSRCHIYLPPENVRKPLVF